MTVSLISGRYELLETLGEGGFAVTWRSWDTRLERPVALKILRPQFAADTQFARRFEREARAAAAVSHPNVVRLYDFGADRDAVYIAMQYVAGGTLRDLLQANLRGLPETDSIRIVTGILRGLDAVHRAGIVHRDVKPDNVLIEPGGEVLITDFGIALLGDTLRLTTADTTFGTAAYMAPEQARGEPVTPSSDIYAAGVVLFEMLTGELPFRAENAVAMLMAHQEQASPPVGRIAVGRQISASTEQAVARALAKQPVNRHASALDFLAALNRPITVPPATRSSEPTVRVAPPVQVRQVVRRAGQRTSRAGLLVLALVIAGLIALGGAYAGGYFDGPKPTPGPLVVFPTSTSASDAEPTIAGIDERFPTDTPESLETTESDVNQPGVIVSEVPDVSPDP